jgi:protein arginine kinase
MDIHKFLISPAETAQRHGPHDRIVMSSRVRLARNLQGRGVSRLGEKAGARRVLDLIRPAVESLPEMKDAFSEAMDNLSALDKQILVERHLISREHAAKSSGSGLVLNREETFCVMINEEDHLRMQALRPGLQLRQAWSAIDHLDSELEKKLDYAFDNDLGYLTACPTNLGTGIRVSAMLHLPGLVLGEQINPIIQSVNKLGLAVRGLYGEGTEALGNVFQVSNQMTLGENETTIVERLEKVLSQIIEHEENARQTLAGEKAEGGVQPHWPRLRHSGQRAQHFVEGNDEPAVAHAAGRGHGPVSRHGTVAGGRVVHPDAAGAFAEAAFRQAVRRGTRPHPRRHGARTFERDPIGVPQVAGVLERVIAVHQGRPRQREVVPFLAELKNCGTAPLSGVRATPRKIWFTRRSPAW